MLKRPNVERLLPALERLRRAPGSPLAHEPRQRLAGCRRPISRGGSARNSNDLHRLCARLPPAPRRPAAVGSDAAISKIAYGVGFSSPSHFTAPFASGSA